MGTGKSVDFRRTSLKFCQPQPHHPKTHAHDQSLRPSSAA
jgi:hypothetical protein